MVIVKNSVNTKVLLVTVLALLSVGFITIVYATDVIDTIRPQSHKIEFIKEIDQNTNTTIIVVNKDGEIIRRLTSPFFRDKSIIIKSPFGKIIGMMSGRFNVTLEDIAETFNQASDITLADNQVKQIIGDNEYTLRGVHFRHNDSNIVNLFLRMIDTHYIVTVNLDQEKVTSIEPANDFGPNFLRQHKVQNNFNIPRMKK